VPSNQQFLIKQVDHALDLPLPARATKDAAGLDLHANIIEPITVHVGERVLIPTGVKIALPFGYEAQLRPRSGLALKYGITVLNTPGTIDADYRGELCALLINHGQEPWVIHRGDRIAQMVINKVEMCAFTPVDALPSSVRNEDGYGSSGVKPFAGFCDMKGVL